MLGVGAEPVGDVDHRRAPRRRPAPARRRAAARVELARDAASRQLGRDTSRAELGMLEQHQPGGRAAEARRSTQSA